MDFQENLFGGHSLDNFETFIDRKKGYYYLCGLSVWVPPNVATW